MERIPLYVRAGSIIPLGPEIEYATQASAGPIELRIFRGADGKLDLYEDKGDYNYEQGAHALIPMRWSEADKTLTITAREGQYPGMPKQLESNIVWYRRDTAQQKP